MAKSKKTTGGRGNRASTKKTTKAARASKTRKAAAKTKSTKASASRKKATTGKTTKPKSTKKVKKAKPRKSRLTKKDLQHFRETLMAKRQTLVSDLFGMEEHAAGRSGGNLSSMPTHMADIGSDNFEHEFTLGLLESEKALLRELDEAIMRIDEGSYGICLGTGEPIPKARLTANPWAKYTVDFTRKLEQGLVRAPDPDAPSLEFEDEEEKE